MNIVDIVILVLLGVSVLVGLYRGFIVTVLSTGGCIGSIYLSLLLYPRLAGLIQGNAGLQRTLLTYTDASSRLGDLETGLTQVTQLTAEKITEIVQKAKLPDVFSGLLRTNLENRVFTGISNVTDYVSETIVTAFINILCFIACFVVIYMVWSLAVRLLDAVFHFPVLKQLNALAGGVFGLLRGLLLVYVCFALVPLVETVLPVQAVSSLIAESRLAPLFNNGVLVNAVMAGRL